MCVCVCNRADCTSRGPLPHLPRGPAHSWWATSLCINCWSITLCPPPPVFSLSWQPTVGVYGSLAYAIRTQFLALSPLTLTSVARTLLNEAGSVGGPRSASDPPDVTPLGRQVTSFCLVWVLKFSSGLFGETLQQCVLCTRCKIFNWRL